MATAPFQPDGQARPLSVSVGAVVFRGRLSVDALLARADALLYAAKQAGRDRVEFAKETLAA